MSAPNEKKKRPSLYSNLKSIKANTDAVAENRETTSSNAKRIRAIEKHIESKSEQLNERVEKWSADILALKTFLHTLKSDVERMKNQCGDGKQMQNEIENIGDLLDKHKEYCEEVFGRGKHKMRENGERIDNLWNETTSLKTRIVKIEENQEIDRDRLVALDRVQLLFQKGDGLPIRIDRLEQQSAKYKWIIGLVIAAIIGQIVSRFM